METEWWRSGDPEPESSVLLRAGNIMKNGGLVAFPTETVYGLGGDAFNPGSSQKIYAAKGRPSDNPLIVHICRISDMEEAAREIPEEAYLLADAFWPGPLTMILKKQPDLPRETTGGLDTVALRFPSHELAQKLIDAAGGFVAAPSANTSGRPSPTEGKYVYEDLAGRIEMLLDDGQASLGLESTIVDLTEAVPTILRPGFVTLEMIQKVLPDAVLDPALRPEAYPKPATTDAIRVETGHTDGSGKEKENYAEKSETRGCKETLRDTAQQGLHPKAPGMKYKHYAPKGEVTIVKGQGEKLHRYLAAALQQAKAGGKKSGLIIPKETEEGILLQLQNCSQGSAKLADSVKITGNLTDAEESAHSLFQFLREFDDEGIDVIYAQAVPEDGIGLAVMNRLKKAAGGRIVEI